MSKIQYYLLAVALASISNTLIISTANLEGPLNLKKFESSAGVTQTAYEIDISTAIEEEDSGIPLRITYDEPRQWITNGKSLRRKGYIQEGQQSEQEYLNNLKERYKEARTKRDYIELQIISHEIELYNKMKQEDRIKEQLEMQEKKTDRKNLVYNGLVLLGTAATVVLTNYFGSK